MRAYQQTTAMKRSCRRGGRARGKAETRWTSRLICNTNYWNLAKDFLSSCSLLDQRKFSLMFLPPWQAAGVLPEGTCKAGMAWWNGHETRECSSWLGMEEQAPVVAQPWYGKVLQSGAVCSASRSSALDRPLGHEWFSRVIRVCSETSPGGDARVVTLFCRYIVFIYLLLVWNFYFFLLANHEKSHWLTAKMWSRKAKIPDLQCRACVPIERVCA